MRVSCKYYVDDGVSRVYGKQGNEHERAMCVPLRDMHVTHPIISEVMQYDM